MLSLIFIAFARPESETVAKLFMKAIAWGMRQEGNLQHWKIQKLNAIMLVN